MMIDYEKLVDSIKYYESNGFIRIDAPWWVSKNVSDVTRPENMENFYIPKNDKCLVASGEQSFICSMIKGRMSEGCFQTITPCFRDERNDPLHRTYFMKNELIDTINVNKNRLMSIIDICLGFFSKYIEKEKLEVVDTKEENAKAVLCSYDINYKNIEIGSYGIRTYLNLNWVYATGCAEPRLSIVSKYANNNIVNEFNC